MNHSVFLGILKLHADAPQRPIPIDSIKNLIPSEQIEIIKMLLSNFINNTPVIHKDNINYKMKYYYNILIFIVNVINNLYTLPNIELYSNNILKVINNKLLYKLCAAYNGNQILERLNILTNIKETHLLNSYILFTATYGTFETFVWWVNFINNTKYIIYSHDLIKRLLTVPFKGKMFIDDLKSTITSFENVEGIFIRSFNNSDNRLLRFFLEVNKINQQINFTDKLIKDILNILNNTTFEPKYILKRLKLLSQNTNISAYFPYIIKTFVSVPVILKLHNLEYYYNTPHTLDNIAYIMLKIQLQNTNMDTLYYEIKKNFIYLLKTSNEIKFAIFCNDISIVIKNKLIRVIKCINCFEDIYKFIIKMIKWYQFDYILNSDIITKDSKLYTHIQSKLNATIQIHPLYRTYYNVSFYKINNALCILSRAMRNNYWFKYNKKLNNELNKRSPIIAALKDRWYYLQFNNFIKKQYITLDNSYKLKKNMYLGGDINLMSTIVVDKSALPSLPVILSSYIIKIIEFKINNPINSENITVYGIIDIDIPDTTYNTRVDMLLDACPHTQMTKHTDSLESYIKEIEKEYENIKEYAIKYKNLISFLWCPIVIHKYTGPTIYTDLNRLINMSLPTYYQKIIPISSLP
jgi:hypothetical protein